MFWQRITGRKSIQKLLAEMAGDERLHRALGLPSLTALGVGAIIGSGIFVMTGRAAAEIAGPAVMVSYLVAALGCLFAALCYSEFAAMAPVAGSAYTYAYATLGELAAWIIGWDLVLEYAMSCATVASAWGNYYNELIRTVFNLQIMPQLCNDPYTQDALTHQYGWFNLPAVLITLAVTTVLVLGIRESALTNTVLTLIKLGVVLFVIGLGLGYIDSANWWGISPANRLSGTEMALHKVTIEYLRERSPDKKVDSQQVGKLNQAAKAEKRIQIESENVQAQLAAGEITAQQAASAKQDIAQRWERKRAEWTNAADIEAVLARAEQQGKVEVAKRWGAFAYVVSPSTLEPIDNQTRTNFTPYGLSGVMLGAALVFFAFIGFDSISTHSEEAINPQRDVPLAILISLGVCTVLYILVCAVITGMEPYTGIDTKAAVAAAFRERAEANSSILLRASAALIALGALAGLTSVILVTFLSQARVFLAMARDRLLPPAIFGVVHPRFKTPHISTILTGLCICLVTAFTPIQSLEAMVNIGTLFAFVVVCIAVLILRFQQPEMHRPFRCPLVGIVAPLGVVFNAGMMLFLPADTWLRLFIWMGIGLVIYALYGYWQSELGRELRASGRSPAAGNVSA